MIVNKIKIKKRWILLMIITLLTNINNCYAANVGFGTLSDDGSGADVETPYEDWAGIRYGNQKYEYRYKQTIKSSTSIQMNGYNLAGESVMPTTTTISDKFKAGTWIGINIIEKHESNWLVSSMEYQLTKKIYTCAYEYGGGSQYKCNSGQVHGITESVCNSSFSGMYDNVSWSNSEGLGICTYSNNCYTSPDKQTRSYTKDYYVEFSCPLTVTHNNHTYKLNETDSTVEDKTEQTTAPEDVLKKAEKEAIDKAESTAIRMVASSVGQVKYITNNSYPISINDLTYDIIKAKKKYPNPKVKNSGTKKGSAEQEYEYLQTKVCMNVKTAQVVYGRDCKSSEGEIKIENASIYDNYLGKNVNYWNYFIPINTPSNAEFFIQVTANSERKLTVNECKDAMEKYKTNYANYIVPDIEATQGKNNIFTGKYKDDNKMIENNNGCYFSTAIDIPIKQEFYNEVEDENGNITFKGFNFYYKPIDINDPFPNGINNTSIWYDWSINDKKNPNLSKSYEEATYVAQIKNASEVRKYTKDNPYTSWDNMYTNGVSTFIEDEGIVTRNDNVRDSFYKLGCGPSNKDWEGCKR